MTELQGWIIIALLSTLVGGSAGYIIATERVSWDNTRGTSLVILGGKHDGH